MESTKRNLILRDRRELQKFERYIEDICEQQNVTQEYFGNIFLALMEVSEILFTFCDDGPSNFLSIQFERSIKGLIFKFVMINNGVEEELSADVVDKEIRRHKLDRELFIAKTLADELLINTNGHVIEIFFYINGISFERSCERINLLKSFWLSRKKVIH
jgi:hypothetical protein